MYIVEQKQEFPFPFPLKGKPKLTVDANTTQEDMEADKETIEAIHKAKVKRHSNTLDTYKTNEELLCGIILEKIMRGAQERESEYAIKK